MTKKKKKKRSSLEKIEEESVNFKGERITMKRIFEILKISERDMSFNIWNFFWMIFYHVIYYSFSFIGLMFIFPIECFQGGGTISFKNLRFTGDCSFW